MLITKRFPIDLTVNEGERAVVAKINTAALDRDNEVVLPAGCDASDYEANPVIFLQHAYWDLPVAKCVALKRDGEAVTAKAVFAERPKDHVGEWVPDTLLSLYQQGVMNAFSIGFEVTESRQPTAKDLENFGGNCRRVISKWKLIEFSCVSVPANAEAVALAVSKGLSKDFAAKVLGFKEPAPAADGNYRACQGDENCGKCQHMKLAPGGGMLCGEDDTECDGQHVCDDFAKMAMEPMDPQKPQEQTPKALSPKRIVYVIESPASPANPADTVAKAVKEQVAKRQGRIYVI